MSYNVVWTLGNPGASCDTVCETELQDILPCASGVLADLNGADDEVWLEAFAAAGIDCGFLRRDCEASASCDLWASPYQHNCCPTSCWGGDQPFVADCSQVPVDGNHKRLCPCQSAASSPMYYGGSSSTDCSEMSCAMGGSFYVSGGGGSMYGMYG
jgi:hypothetical protein